MKDIQIAFAALFILSLTHQVSSANFTNSTLSIAPQLVLNSTDSSGNFSNPILVPTGNGSSLAILGMRYDNTSANYSFVQRSLDASSFLPIANDTDLGINITSAEEPLVTSSPNGILAAASTFVHNLTTQVYLNIFPFSSVNSSNLTQVQITNNTDPNYTFDFAQVFYLNGYFYLLYTAYSMSNTSLNDIYLQGVSAASPNVSFFSTPLHLNSNGSTLINAEWANCGQHGTFSLLHCNWKKVSTGNLISVMVDLVNKNATNETIIATDTTNWFYTPLAIVPGSNYCAQIYAGSSNANASTQGSFLQVNVQLSFFRQAYALPYSLPSGMQEFTFGGAQPFYGGWFVVYNQYSVNSTTNATSSSVGVNAYQKDGTMNGTQTVIALNGTVSSVFVASNGAAYILVTNTTFSNGSGWDVAYLAQLYQSTSYPAQAKSGFSLLVSYCSLVMAIIALYMI